MLGLDKYFVITFFIALIFGYKMGFSAFVAIMIGFAVVKIFYKLLVK